MQLFKFFKRKKDNNSIYPSYSDIIAKSSSDNFDKNEVILKLFQIPKSNRDDLWLKIFLENIIDAEFEIQDPQVLVAPDGFRYINLLLSSDTNGVNYFSLKDMIPFLLRDGLGITINVDKGGSQWVFRYGDILDFYLNDQFYSIKIQEESYSDSLKCDTINNNQLLVFSPSESYLPKETRKVIRRFLNSYGIKPKICVTSSGGSPKEWTLIFNIVPEMFKNPDEKQVESLLFHISWYLPQHYQIASMRENNYFIPL